MINRRFVRKGFLCYLGIIAAMISIATGTPPQKPNGTIFGLIRTSGANTPTPVQIKLFSLETNAYVDHPLLTITDDAFSYEFTGLTRGYYRVVANGEGVYPFTSTAVYIGNEGHEKC